MKRPKFCPKPLTLAVCDALEDPMTYVRAEVKPQEVPTTTEDPKTMKRAARSTKVYLKNIEFKAVADHMFSTIIAEGKEPPFGSRSINMTKHFFAATKAVLPAERQPHSLSQYMREMLVSKLNYRYKKYLETLSSKPAVIGATKATKRRGTTVTTVNADSFTMIIDGRSVTVPSIEHGAKLLKGMTGR